MPVKDAVDFEKLLQSPAVQKVISKVNNELEQRRNYELPHCDAFLKPHTSLTVDDSYSFSVDREARKQLPRIINNRVQRICGVDSLDESTAKACTRARNIGIVFSGGPAPGGHNVIAGLYDSAKRINPDSKIFGFLLGPDGVIENEAVELTRSQVDAYRNLGGFSMIRTGRTKIDTDIKVENCRETCRKLGLDALVIVGGDDSNTNAAFLAEQLYDDGVQVIGVPKTIDGDIQVRDEKGRVLCAMSFGFHTAARAFATSVANLCTDSSSDVKYWHICKVMGRTASHLALETALQSHANMILIGEDLADYIDLERIAKAERSGEVDYTAYGMTLRHLSRVICDGIVKRAAVGKNYGVIVIPEGVLEFINEIQTFIIKLNTIIADYNLTHDTSFHTDFVTLDEKLDHLRWLARRSREERNFNIWNTRDDDLFNDIPAFFQEGLLTERDSHGNFQYSLVETDKVLMGLVRDYLNILMELGTYKIGIEQQYFRKNLEQSGLDPDYYGPILFKEYPAPYLIVKPTIISLKTLNQALVKAEALSDEDQMPAAVVKMYQKSVPKFKTQGHFYGYDGRGNDPTQFDCTYTYNLGLTVFNLIAHGATGQMAAINNLEFDFADWQPLGIPIAPLMHLEERKGKLALVIEKSLVDINSNAFKVAESYRSKWLAAKPGEQDDYRHPGPPLLGPKAEDRPITLYLNSLGREPE